MAEPQKYGILLNKDAKLHRKYFEELLRLQGILIRIKTPKDSSKTYTLNGELIGNYGDWYDTGCIFDEHPNQKTMRKLGWFVEGDTDSSLISLPYDTPNLQQGTLVSIPSGLDDGQNRTFRIVEMSNIMVYPASITCKIVPEWEDTMTLAETHNYTKSSYNSVKEVDESRRWGS